MNFIGDFTDKVVLITGAARGIGRETARQFAACGARIALHYCSSRTEAEASLSSLAGQSHALFQADLTSSVESARLVQEVIAEMGRIDVLVNNAAVFELHRIAEVGYEEWQAAWRHTIDANLIGAANLIYCASQHMIAQRSGRIINISSRGAFRGEPEAPAYGASKAALNAMSQSLAQALAPHNVFVYVIAPGFVDTERVAWKVHGPQGDAIREQSPLGRVARPEEVARTALFLASEGTDFLTGCIVDVNGASYLRT